MASRSGSARTCMCSPTNHPGSFRCSRHKKPPRAVVVAPPSPQTPYYSKPHHHWDASLKRILLQMLKRSTHDLHKRKTFQPKPTRFSLMNANTPPPVAVN